MKKRVIASVVIVSFFLLLFLIVPLGMAAKRLTYLNEKSFDFNFWGQLWVNFFSGLIFTLFLFFLNEIIFKEPDLTGVWVMETEMKLSSTIPGFVLGYKIHLLQKSIEIEGVGEKIYEIDQENNIKEFLAINTSTIVSLAINGFIGKNYLKKSEISISLTEKGTKRESITIMKLRFIKDDELVGNFSTTAANSYGRVRLKKTIL